MHACLLRGRLGVALVAVVAMVLPLTALSPAQAVATVKPGGLVSRAPGTFTSLASSRLLDTRAGVGAPVAGVGAHGTVHLKVTGRGGVPASGVSAVVLNVTVTGPAQTGFVTVYGAGATRPGVSDLNFVKGQTVPNLVIAPVGTGGVVDP
jgi:hypothetical protein